MGSLPESWNPYYFSIWNFRVNLLSSVMKVIRRIFSWRLCFLRKKKKQNPLHIASSVVQTSLPMAWAVGHFLSQWNCYLDRSPQPLAPGHASTGTKPLWPPRVGSTSYSGISDVSWSWFVLNHWFPLNFFHLFFHSFLLFEHFLVSWGKLASL